MEGTRRAVRQALTGGKGKGKQQYQIFEFDPTSNGWKGVKNSIITGPHPFVPFWHEEKWVYQTQIEDGSWRTEADAEWYPLSEKPAA